MTSEQDVLGLFEKWNQALATLNPDKVVECYAEHATLLPTVSNQVRYNHEEIRDYFVHFLKLKPQGVIDESAIRVFDDIAINSGIYTFSVEKDGAPAKVQARYTYVYQNIEDQWLIIEHHSSAMPEG